MLADGACQTRENVRSVPNVLRVRGRDIIVNVGIVFRVPVVAHCLGRGLLHAAARWLERIAWVSRTEEEGAEVTGGTSQGSDIQEPANVLLEQPAAGGRCEVSVRAEQAGLASPPHAVCPSPLHTSTSASVQAPSSKGS
jgi:hypothetical protein